MLHAVVKGTGRPGDVSLVLMHFLGGSGREWDEVIALLEKDYRTIAVDMPGFGGSAEMPGYSVEQMADAVESLVGSLRLGRYVLVGHSMSGKVAAVVARRFADRSKGSASDGQGTGPGSIHAERLDELEGLILIAPSPPEPEPMGEEKRTNMLAALGEEKHGDRARARAYITKNEERDIAPEVLERAVNEVLKMKRAAWVAWLERGSKEDWAERVGMLDLPALVVAGDKDRSLGPEQQRATTMKHLAHAELRIVPGCSHLVPMERPGELAGMLREFVDGLSTANTSVPAEYRLLIDSDRVSPQTRAVLEERMAGPRSTTVLDAMQILTLRAVCERLLPQRAGSEIDLAGTIAARLASGKGDGWRYAVLPEDSDAYRHALNKLAESGFERMSDEAKDECLRELTQNKASAEARWFEELRGDATTAYMSHPATYARIGYSGIGVGGANTPQQGFVAISTGEVEPWEPKPAQDRVVR